MTFNFNRHDCAMVDRECIDICPGWMPLVTPGQLIPSKEKRQLAPSPLTILLGGNGAGKSAVFDAVLFVLGQVSSRVSFIFGSG